MVTEPWGVRFRPLFTAPGVTVKGLDPRLHYIFPAGIYGAYLPASRRWELVLCIKDMEEEEQVFAGDVPSIDAVAALRAYLAKHLPVSVVRALGDAELEAFFSRKCFGGAVVPHLSPAPMTS